VGKRYPAVGPDDEELAVCEHMQVAVGRHARSDVGSAPFEVLVSDEVIKGAELRVGGFAQATAVLGHDGAPWL